MMTPAKVPAVKTAQGLEAEHEVKIQYSHWVGRLRRLLIHAKGLLPALTIRVDSGTHCQCLPPRPGVRAMRVRYKFPIAR